MLTLHRSNHLGILRRHRMGHLPGGSPRQDIRFAEADAPVEVKLELRLDGVEAGSHDGETPLGDGLRPIRGHQRSLHHLESFAGVVLALGDTTTYNRVTAESLRRHLGRLAVGRKAAATAKREVRREIQRSWGVGQLLAKSIAIVYRTIKWRFSLHIAEILFP